MGRKVTIEGNLKVHLLSWTPSATIEGIHVANPAWVTTGGDMTQIDKLSVQVRLKPLFHGEVILPLLRADHPNVVLLQDATGDNNWVFGNPDKAQKPFALPPIERFEINNGQLKIDEAKRKLTFTGTVNSSEVQDGKNVQAFSLNGDGKLNGEPFTAKVSGGPLLKVDLHKPYPFSLDIHAGLSHVFAQGSITKPFNLAQINTRLDLSGPDLARLYYLTGLALPNTPPYSLTGDLVRSGTSYTFTHVHGRVGSSDLAGEFKVARVDDRPNLHADLHSHFLNVLDLGSLVGAPKPGARTPAQQAQMSKVKAEGRLMPDATLNVARVRSTDATLHYTADQMTAQGILPMSHVLLDLKLDHGLLTLSPLNFSLPRGTVTSKIRIDARADTPKDDVDVRVTNAHLEDFFKSGANAPVQGMLEARAQLHGVGDSVHKAAATANGTAALAVPGGKVRKLIAEGLGIDVVNALGIYLAKDQSDTDLRCAVADFSASNGVLSVHDAVLDTDRVLAKGSGDVNLGAETLNFSLTGEPKKFRVGRLMAPITLSGPIRSPKVGVKAGKAPAQAGVAVALGAVFPLAAILPFIDPGLAKNANCAGLLTEARATGAPVKASVIASAPKGGGKK
jgi:uncharacterized protein involved in outer membrane biogenesis